MSPVPKELQPIVDLMHEDSPVKHSYMMNGNMFFIEGEANYLYMRFLKKEKIITVANIFFFHERQGYFTRLFQLLQDYMPFHLLYFTASFNSFKV